MHILIIVTLGLVSLIIILSKKAPPPKIETIGSEYEREISEQQFDSLVIETSKATPVLVDFYADWCPPCRYLTPLLAEMAKEYNGAFLLAKINSDTNKRAKEEHGVQSIPTVFLYIDGEPVEMFVGGKLEHSIRFTLAKHGIEDPGSAA